MLRLMLREIDYCDKIGNIHVRYRMNVTCVGQHAICLLISDLNEILLNALCEDIRKGRFDCLLVMIGFRRFIVSLWLELQFTFRGFVFCLDGSGLDSVLELLGQNMLF